MVNLGNQGICRINSLKGNQSAAQGNRPGNFCRTVQCIKALKGHKKYISPFQGSAPFGFLYPGRLPWAIVFNAFSVFSEYIKLKLSPVLSRNVLWQLLNSGKPNRYFLFYWKKLGMHPYGMGRGENEKRVITSLRGV